MDANNTTEQTAIQAAIKYFTDRSPMNCGVMYEQYTAVAEWLQELVDSRIKIKILETELKADHQKAIDTANELAAYKDKTYISEDFLARNGFEKRKYWFLYCDEVEEIAAQCIDAEMGVWCVSVGFLDHCENTESLNICTVGQLRMFLAIEGLNEIAKKIK